MLLVRVAVSLYIVQRAGKIKISMVQFIEVDD